MKRQQKHPRILPLWLSVVCCGALVLAPLSSAFPTTSSFSRHRHYLPSLRVSSSTSSLVQAFSNKEFGDDVYTIQILMSDTGGGHRASANALRDAFDSLYPGKIQCDIVDLYTEYGPFWPYNDYVAMYKLMAKYDFLWDGFYHFGETNEGLWLNENLLETFCFDSFKQCLARPSGTTGKRADMVVSVHPLCQDIPLKILSELDSDGRSRSPNSKTTPFATVVTDLAGAHKTWFNRNVDKCFVPTDVLADKARSRGLQQSQIVQHGLPIRKGFWSPSSECHNSESANTNSNIVMSKNIVRAVLGIDPNLPTVLVVGGGDGMGGIEKIAKALGQTLGKSSNKPSYQMVVVCGKNQEARKALEDTDWEKGVRVFVKGFVDNMDEWMNGADALVTKAGPGTIAEASICGLPCMLFAYLPGQEEGNVPFVENSGFGKFSADPDVIADTVSSWLASPTKMEAMREAAFAAARPSATLDIARDLADMVFATRKGKQVQEDPLPVASNNLIPTN